MRWQDHITVTAGVRGGKPCIKGTRLTGGNVLDYLASGMTEEQILSDFPQLRPEHIKAVIAFAAELAQRLSVPQLA